MTVIYISLIREHINKLVNYALNTEVFFATGNILKRYIISALNGSLEPNDVIGERLVHMLCQSSMY